MNFVLKVLIRVTVVFYCSLNMLDIMKCIQIYLILSKVHLQMLYIMANNDKNKMNIFICKDTAICRVYQKLWDVIANIF